MLSIVERRTLRKIVPTIKTPHPRDLDEKERRVVEAILDFWVLCGLPPSCVELADILGVCSGTIRRWIDRAAIKGHLEVRRRKARWHVPVNR
jgi:hypothetical protein